MFQPNQPAYTIPALQVMYAHYLTMYQQRYLPRQITVTWQTISFWRTQVTAYGQMLINHAVLTKKQYLADKATIIEMGTDNKLVNIDLVKEQIPHYSL